MELVRTEVKITVYGKEVNLFKPSFGQIREMQRKQELGGKENELDVVGSFLKDLGMPEDMLNSLEIGHLEAIVKHLTDQKKTEISQA